MRWRSHAGSSRPEPPGEPAVARRASARDGGGHRRDPGTAHPGVRRGGGGVLAARRLDDVRMGHHALGRVDPRCRDARESSRARVRGSKPALPALCRSRGPDRRRLPVVGSTATMSRGRSRYSSRFMPGSWRCMARSRYHRDPPTRSHRRCDGGRGRRRRLSAHRRAGRGPQGSGRAHAVACCTCSSGASRARSRLARGVR
jgi:hypothetical protein